MEERNNAVTSRIGLYVGLLIVFSIVPILISVMTNLWVFTAISIGTLFGFFLQKGDLCGASAFSEVILLGRWRKVYAIWVAIVVSAIGFAVLNSLGWIVLNPKPFIWLNYLVGGVIFGVGMVLAGGCVSGCLFKAGSGNLNSMAGLIGIPIGVAAVEYGPLSSVHQFMKQFVIRAKDGSSVTLATLTGIPYWALALGLGIATLVVAFVLKKTTSESTVTESVKDRILTKSWKPWVAGIAIGLIAVPAYLSSAASGRNYPLGVTHGVLHAELLLTDKEFNHVVQKKPAPSDKTGVSQSTKASAVASASKPQKKIVWWLVALIVSLMFGSFLSGKMSGEARLLPKPPEQIVVAFFGGILVGMGAALATGCVVGNIFSGWALMSVGNYFFAVVVILSNWITTYFYLLGGTIAAKR